MKMESTLGHKQLALIHYTQMAQTWEEATFLPCASHGLTTKKQ
jgi:hypothetical protein